MIMTMTPRKQPLPLLLVASAVRLQLQLARRYANETIAQQFLSIKASIVGELGEPRIKLCRELRLSIWRHAFVASQSLRTRFRAHRLQRTAR